MHPPIRPCLHYCAGSMRLVFEQMGHAVLSDRKCVDYLCRELERLGKSIEATSAMSRWQQLSSVRGEHFEASIRLTPNYDHGDDSAVVEVTLHRRGSGRPRERFLYLRPKAAGKRLAYPRSWRRLGGLRTDHTGNGGGDRVHHGGQGKTKTAPRGHRKLLFAEASRDIYWKPEVSSEDLKAQVVIALLQLGMLPKGSQLQEWLVDVAA